MKKSIVNYALMANSFGSDSRVEDREREYQERKEARKSVKNIKEESIKKLCGLFYCNKNENVRRDAKKELKGMGVPKRHMKKYKPA